MKWLIYVGFTVFGLLGSWIGAALNHNNWFGLMSSVLGIVGSLVGIWVGYIAGRYLEL